jgi:DNA-binding LacI/PurR family transcriptional regulator
MPVTQKDVARTANVTQRTVSRCFCLPEAVNAATLERVLGICRELGYRPNTAARTIRKGRFDSVGLLHASASEGWRLPGSFLWSVNRRLGEHQLHLVLCDLPVDEPGAESGRAPKILNQHMVDGVLIHGGEALPGAVLAQARDARHPVVWVNALRESACICADEERAGAEATALLVRMGHRRILYVTREPGNGGAGASHHDVSSGRRQAGYERAMGAAGLTPAILRLERRDEGGAAGRLATALRGPERPTALLACHLGDAQAAIFVAQGVLRLVVPQDLSLIAFADESREGVPHVASYVLPWPAMGLMAVDLVVRQLKDPQAPVPPVILAMDFEPGMTLAPPPAG